MIILMALCDKGMGTKVCPLYSPFCKLGPNHRLGEKGESKCVYACVSVRVSG